MAETHTQSIIKHAKALNRWLIKREASAHPAHFHELESRVKTLGPFAPEDQYALIAATKALFRRDCPTGCERLFSGIIVGRLIPNRGHIET